MERAANDRYLEDHARAGHGQHGYPQTAPDTPLTGAFIARVVQEQTDIPPGVFNVISSQDKAAAGEALTGDPRVDMYHFTGSPGVGQRIAERAADGIRTVCWNSAANRPMSSSPTPTSTWGPSWGGDVHVQQRPGLCAGHPDGGHAAVYDEVLQRLTAMVGTAVGRPHRPGKLVGPVIRLEQLERIEGLVDRARADGARVLCGGRRGDRRRPGDSGIEPTVVADVDENAEIAQTEVFGPVLTVVARRRRRRGGAGRQQLPVRAVGLRPVRRSKRAWAIARGCTRAR